MGNQHIDEIIWNRITVVDFSNHDKWGMGDIDDPTVTYLIKSLHLIDEKNCDSGNKKKLARLNITERMDI